jgi:hypothetical protein
MGASVTKQIQEANIDVVTNVINTANQSLDSENSSEFNWLSDNCDIEVFGDLDTSSNIRQAQQIRQYGDLAARGEIQTAVTAELMESAKTTMEGLAFGFAGSFQSSTLGVTISSSVQNVTNQTLKATNNSNTGVTCTGSNIVIHGDWKSSHSSDQSIIAEQLGSQDLSGEITTQVDAHLEQDAETKLEGLNLGIGVIILAVVLLMLIKPVMSVIGIPFGFLSGTKSTNAPVDPNAGTKTVVYYGVLMLVCGVVLIVSGILGLQFSIPCNANAQCRRGKETESDSAPGPYCSCTDQYTCGGGGKLTNASIGVSSPPLQFLYSVYEGTNPGGMFAASIRRMAIRKRAGFKPTGGSAKSIMNNSGFNVKVYLDMMDTLDEKKSTNTAAKIAQALMRFFQNKTPVHQEGKPYEPAFDELRYTLDGSAPDGWNGLMFGNCAPAFAEAIIPLRPYHLPCEYLPSCRRPSACKSSSSFKGGLGPLKPICSTRFLHEGLSDPNTMVRGAPNIVRPMCWTEKDGRVYFYESDDPETCNEGMDKMWTTAATRRFWYEGKAAKWGSDEANLINRPLGAEGTGDELTRSSCTVGTERYDGDQTMSLSPLWDGGSRRQCGHQGGIFDEKCRVESTTDCASLDQNKCNNWTQNKGAAFGANIGYARSKHAGGDGLTRSTAMCQQVGANNDDTVFVAMTPTEFTHSLTRKASLNGKTSQKVGSVKDKNGNFKYKADDYCREAMGFNRDPSKNVLKSTKNSPEPPFMAVVDSATSGSPQYMGMKFSGGWNFGPGDAKNAYTKGDARNLSTYGNEPAGYCGYQTNNFIKNQKICTSGIDMKHCWTKQLCEANGGAWKTTMLGKQPVGYCADKGLECSEECSNCNGQQQCVDDGPNCQWLGGDRGCQEKCNPAAGICSSCGKTECSEPCKLMTWGGPKGNQNSMCTFSQDPCTKCDSAKGGNLGFDFNLAQIPDPFLANPAELATVGENVTGCLPAVFVPDPLKGGFHWDGNLCAASLACCTEPPCPEGVPPCGDKSNATMFGDAQGLNPEMTKLGCNSSEGSGCYHDGSKVCATKGDNDNYFKTVTIPNQQTPYCFYQNSKNLKANKPDMYLATYNPELQNWVTAQKGEDADIRQTMWYMINRIFSTCMMYYNKRQSTFSLAGFSTFMNPGGKAENSDAPMYPINTLDDLKKIDILGESPLHQDRQVYVWFTGQPLLVKENGVFQFYTLRDIMTAGKGALLGQINTFVYDQSKFGATADRLAQLGLRAVDEATFDSIDSPDKAFEELSGYSGTIYGAFGRCEAWYNSDAWVGATLGLGSTLIAGTGAWWLWYFLTQRK